MTERSWLSASYPPGVPADIDASLHPSLVALIEELPQVADRVAYSFMGKEVSYADRPTPQPRPGRLPAGPGAWPGDRVGHHDAQRAAVPGHRGGHPARRPGGGERQPAVHPARTGASAPGLGAKAIVILENFATTLKCIAKTPVKHVVLASHGRPARPA